MDAQALIGGVQPLAGQVLPVKTVQETQAPEEFADAFAAEVNVKCASKVIKALDSKFNRDTSLSHLRRFAKRNQLPEALQSTISQYHNHNGHSSHTIFVLISPPIPDLDTLHTLLAPFAPGPPAPEEDPPTESCSSDTSKIPFYPVRIPLQPPLNARQAEKWTKAMWPVIFNPAAPRANVAPPPQILNRALDSIKPRAGYYMALAQKLADEAEQSGLGRNVGAVIVDPAIEETIEGGEWDQAVVAVAGDARYSRLDKTELQLGQEPNPASQTYNADLEGGPELHALMRAVDIVARRRREDNTPSATDNGYLSPLESHFFYQFDAPLVSDTSDISPVPEKLQKTNTTTAHCTKTAEPAVSTSRIRPRTLGGYLCTDLDVYLSREPCLCCSMGVLLSRFRAVIFPRRGRMVTGGIASEPVVSPVCDDDDADDEENDTEPIENTGDKSRDTRNNRKYYGLHWRKELNWRALGFEFVEDAVSFEMGIEGEAGVAFHA
ncbi:putative tRNA-specific adenosine-34 deaminase subunit Tad3 [Aspergillus chevalieri]|uniref:tRNA-specific adenosine deaminase subunit tad3 n=1 Tax=Aspergillus chevalieri TaxID=182096 RepID=A0A7R7VFM5_ASPCH|nr:tRNA-specific adenosine deaminase subunit tad3 [Aspergillus chevalieri]BCR83907.1 tRNA-specific adenosine deaminase subunit tad3 [Aspergillus chevalieri]